MKNFNKENFLGDLERQRWSDVNLSNDANEMWAKWKNMSINCIDKRAPLRTKKLGKRNPHGSLANSNKVCVSRFPEKES